VVSSASCLRSSSGSGWSLVALTVFKTVRDLTTSGWVGSIPMHSRQHRSRRMAIPNPMHLTTRSGIPLVLLALFASTIPVAASAQVSDSARALSARLARADSLHTPIGPRRAFVYSFLVPGYSQSVLGRNKAAAAFLLVEAISLGMIRESAADRHEARRIENDTLVISYVDASGNAGRITAPPRFNEGYVHTRAAHVEDWVALLVANHLFAGADAYVAANLWDVPARLGVRLLPDGRSVLSASFKW
jgi:hypothetical protein